MNVRSSWGNGSQHLADAGDPSPAPEHAERDVRTEAGRGLDVVEADPPQDRRGVGRPPTQPGAAGNLLVHLHAAGDPHQRQSPGDEVAAGLEALGVGTDEGHPVAVPDAQGVRQVDGHHLGVDPVETVLPHADHPQGEGQLGRGRQDDRKALGHEPTASASRPQAAMSNCSGRVSEATPAVTNCASVTRPSSDRRSILRRLPNA